ncbi:ABC transporter ATP-binding protein [Skermanella aerolata]|uniref:ABC transporter ATP-binding protein n=1 Tax=Skermanella aerolata TaxID=393310 RepID=A0A512DIH9_9PROT|nr:oligopeptide/dipeptide ABC transporter ATP-binding protein [Skermanella aerolata]GEO36262.1 ABC transporter ATP-binding protein [Skermanella aerolata]
MAQVVNIDAPKANILEVEGLKKHFPTSKALIPGGGRTVKAVDGVSFTVVTGETLAIVGESGCGKSTLARLILRLTDLTDGTVKFHGQDIAKLSERQMRPLRARMQMIFQDPFASLNPRMSVAEILTEPMIVHKLGDRRERRERMNELLGLVGLSPRHADRYPHEFSGGQRQRIGIARALAAGPELVIGDEPVSALDVSVQAQVINLLEDLKRRLGLTLVIISHDLAVVRHMSDRVGVMYLGKMVELAPTAELFASPRHPYTRALMSAVPLPDPSARSNRQILEGDVPSPLNPPSGCRFHTRCPYVRERCRTEEPLLDSGVACHFWREIEALPGPDRTAKPISDAYQRRRALYMERRVNQDDAVAAG